CARLGVFVACAHATPMPAISPFAVIVFMRRSPDSRSDALCAIISMLVDPDLELPNARRRQPNRLLGGAVTAAQRAASQSERSIADLRSRRRARGRSHPRAARRRYGDAR